MRRLWAYFVILQGLTWSMTIAVWLSMGGLGVGAEGGEFVARQGKVRAEINQSVGLLVSVTQLAAVLTFLPTTIATYYYVNTSRMRTMRSALQELGPEGDVLLVCVRCALGLIPASAMIGLFVHWAKG